MQDHITCHSDSLPGPCEADDISRSWVQRSRSQTTFSETALLQLKHIFTIIQLSCRDAMCCAYLGSESAAVDILSAASEAVASAAA